MLGIETLLRFFLLLLRFNSFFFDKANFFFFIVLLPFFCRRNKSSFTSLIHKGVAFYRASHHSRGWQKKPRGKRQEVLKDYTAAANARDGDSFFAVCLFKIFSRILDIYIINKFIYLFI